MSINTNSSSSEISSLPTSTENATAMPIQTTSTDSSSLNNSTQISMTHDPTVGDETPKPSSVGNPKTKKNKFSIWDLLFRSKRKTSEPKPDDNKNATATHNGDSKRDVENLKELIDHDLKFISDETKKLEKFISEETKNLEKFERSVKDQAKDAMEEFKNIKGGEILEELRELKKTVTKLKIDISSKIKIHSEENDPRRNQQSYASAKSKLDNVDKLGDKMPNLFKNATFENSPQFLNFQALYNGLDMESKLCLLCFSVFPENAIIKKRLMVYWWMAEGFVPPITRDIKTEKTPVDYADEIFRELMEKGFIEPENKEPISMVGSCKMHPFIRSAVISLADKAKFFDFDKMGNPIADFTTSNRACLTGEGLTNIKDLEKLHMLFNVNDQYLEFKPEWFSKMRNVNILYLGRWQTSDAHHIEVEETNFLEGLNTMKHLRFFSLQGVSRITELPNSISQLTSLEILDLRSCHNLEVIPKAIGSLKSLTHFDMSKCYLLDHVSKELSTLSELQVLKGFLVIQSKNSCTLDDLAKLPKLKKLSIYTGVKDFPTGKHLSALQQFQALRKLTVEWGGRDLQGKPDNISHTSEPDGGDRKQRRSAVERPRAPSRKKEVCTLPSKLEKLDLKCFPGTITPNWLTPGTLKGLKKLHIRGGKFSDLGQFQELDESVRDVHKWAVEVLRLKFLSELEMDWREMQELFPNLIYLEKVNCPKLTLFPCNESGLWMNKTKLKLLVW